MITRYAALLARRHSAAPSRPFADSMSSSSPSSSDDWIPLQSATGRARKRRRKIAARQTVATKKGKEPPVKVISPQGWRVLWPDPYGDTSSWTESFRGLPSLADFSYTWRTYKSTWAGGLRGDLPVVGEEENDDDSTSLDPDQMKKNLTNNVSAARDEAHRLKEEVSNRTGIRTQADLKDFAKDMMTLAKECLEEFMSGYRNGRDQEVDRMMNDYFQEEEAEEMKKKKGVAKRKRRRKPKRAILRT
ncbi:unnamed protein product [Cylindrotheca closterium]|uniref:Uncharacterized protein n=1 Tax=Cylindrotheca closterium TaxID=2856 RepID=A0AAD2FJC6_9STRA|nr:unnamed protein product [Cylindrotheca closterium]